MKLKSDTPSRPRITASPSMTNCLRRFFNAASAVHRKRFVQSWPPLVIRRTDDPARRAADSRRI
jgi:hypothetical protein